jgi:hypothetical protein
MLVENISDDLFSYSLGRRQKQIIDNSVLAVPHRERVRYVAESGNCALAGQLLAAALGGVLYAIYVENVRRRDTRRPWLDPKGLALILPAVLVVGFARVARRLPRCWTRNRVLLWLANS